MLSVILLDGIGILWRKYNFLTLERSIFDCSRAIALEQSFIDLSRAQKTYTLVYKKILILEQALELVIFFLSKSEPPKNVDTLHIIIT